LEHGLCQQPGLTPSENRQAVLSGGSTNRLGRPGEGIASKACFRKSALQIEAE